jgi:hypothetical protein
MAESPEHVFLKKGLEEALNEFSATGLLGITEADRGKFDFACRLERDFKRALDAEICWGNAAGLPKDIHHLVVGSEAPIRLLIMRGSVDSHRQLDEILGDHRRRNPSSLTGFRYLALPDGFDADDEAQREWMGTALKRRLCSDLLFGVMFGHLRHHELRSFINHGGPFGLKCAVLELCSRSPISSMSELMDRLGKVSKGPVRECVIMLTATGLLHQMPHSQPCFPTLKGRFLLDLMTRLLFEARWRSDWAPELKIILDHLSIPSTFLSENQIVESVERRKSLSLGLLGELLISPIWSAGYFGIDLTARIDVERPIFYSELDWSRFQHIAFGESLTVEQLLDLG